MKYKIFILISLVCTFSCKKEDKSVVYSNSTPKILSLTADNTTLNCGESTNVYCEAEDVDGDQIQYQWISNIGSFNVTHVSAVTWKAPDVYEQTQVELTVTISDPLHNSADSRQIIITVLPPDPGVITETLYPSDDSYVSSISPNDNYGYELGLYTGHVNYGGAGDEYCSTFLKFDVSAIPSNVQIEKVELILITGFNNTLVKPTGSTYIKGVMNSPWNEGSITHSNKPYVENTVITANLDIIFDVLSEQRFDVKDHFVSHYKLNPSYSLMAFTSFLSEDSYASYYSKEAGASLKPKLYIEYITK